MSKPTNLKIREVFNMPEVKEQVKTLGYEPHENPFIPSVNNDYVFRKELIREVTAFLKAPHGDALYVTGPTGSGKTSGITEIAARLNWPVQQITANGRMELTDLVGMHSLVSEVPGSDPSMKFMYGPLVKAMKAGHILLINEVDLAEPDELSGLNDVLEGRPLVITQNGGELIKPHPMFRVIVTGNSVGAGDESGLFQGIKMQNIAAMDRYRFIEVDYPTEEVELGILERAAPTLHEPLRQGMVKVANRVRKLFTGEGDEDGHLSVTMSTRTLVRWAKLSLQFRGAPNTLNYALKQALLTRTSDAEGEAILRIAKDVFGEAWK